MLIAIDAGNSNVKISAMDHFGEIKEKIIIKTDKNNFDLSPAMDLILSLNHTFTNCVICSVVPEINNRINDFIKQSTGIDSILVSHELDAKIEYKYDNPANIGPDRISNVLAAIAQSGAPVIVVDFGTATTLSAGLEQNEFSGGLIAPGVETSLYALSVKSSKLPYVSIAGKQSLIGNSTEECMGAGVYNMQLGFIDYVIKKTKKKYPELKTYCSGGFASYFKHKFDVHDENLVLKGCFEFAKRLGYEL